jgi:predicted dienelactone hydrolase
MRIHSPNLLLAGLTAFVNGHAFACDPLAVAGTNAIKSLDFTVTDESRQREIPLRAMQQAASAQNFLLHVKDVPVVLDQLTAWNKTPGHVLAGRLDLNRVGMSGHSFGAVTTQAVSGQHFTFNTGNDTDPRIKAAIAFSPSAPRAGKASDAFGTVKIPWLLMTGTKDTAPIGHADAKAWLDGTGPSRVLEPKDEWRRK